MLQHKFIDQEKVTREAEEDNDTEQEHITRHAIQTCTSRALYMCPSTTITFNSFQNLRNANINYNGVILEQIKI